MSTVRIAAASAHFGRDLDFDLSRIAKIIDDARRAEARLLVLPDAALGGYLADLRHPDPTALPPALSPDDPVIAQVAAMAAEMIEVFPFERTRDYAAVRVSLANSFSCSSGVR